MLTPLESSCAWIGPRGREPAPLALRPGGPVVHSQFEPHPDYINAKPQTFIVPVTPVEPMAKTGTRSADEE
jgi:hypothetical protein